MSKYSELDKLYDKYMDKSLTEKDESRLISLLDDKSMQKRWRLISYLEGKLYEEISCSRSGVFERYSLGTDTDASSHMEPETIKLPWYARVKYVALLMVGVLIFTYFYNEYQYQQTEEIIRARLKEFNGNVEIERQGQLAPVENGMRFYSGDRIKTRSQAQAVIQFDQEDTQIVVSENTDVRVVKENAYKRFSLARGVVACKVEKQSAGSGFVVDTPLAEARIKGTRFAVEAHEDQSRLKVLTGSVIFARLDNSMELEVCAGHEGVIRKNSPDIVMHPSGKLGKGLVAYWPGSISEGRLLDVSGNSRHGVIHGDVKSTVGILGSAIQLDGKTGHVRLNLPEQGSNNKPFAITMWTRSVSGHQKERSSLFSSFSESQPKHSFQLDVCKEKGKPDVFRWNSAGGKAAIGVVQPVWTHVAVTYDGSHIHTYHNAKLMKNEKIKQPPLFSQAALGVNRAGNTYFKGWLDEICVYDRALEHAEITDAALIVGRRKDRQTPAVNTAEEATQYLSAQGFLSLETGTAILRDRFRHGLSNWRQLGSFKWDTKVKLIQNLNALLQGNRLMKKGFSHVHTEKKERNGKKESVMVLDPGAKVVLVELKQGITIGNGLEVSMNVFINKPETTFMRSFLHIHNGGWMQEPVFTNEQMSFPLKKWFQIKSIMVPEMDETGHGNLTSITLMDQKLVRIQKFHCYYSGRGNIYPYMYAINGRVYVSDFTVKRLNMNPSKAKKHEREK